MSILLKNILVLAIVFLSFSLKAQLLKYKIQQRGTVKQHFDDSSVHLSRISNNTFRLDSISPQGQQFELLRFPVSGSGDWLFNYDYSPRLGLFTSRASNEPSMCADCYILEVSHYSKTGDQIWQKRINPGNRYGNYLNYQPRVIGDSLYIYGQTNGIDYGDQKSVMLILNIDGEVLENEPLGCCGNNNFLKEDGKITVAYHRNYTYADVTPESDVIVHYDSNFQRLNRLYLEGKHFPSVKRKHKIINAKLLGSGHYYGAVKGEFGSYLYPAIVSEFMGNSKWTDISPLVNFIEHDSYVYEKHIYDVVKYYDGFLILYGQAFMNNTNSSFDSTELYLNFLNASLTTSTPIWRKTDTGYIEKGSLKTYEDDIYIRSRHKNGTYEDYYRKNYLWRINDSRSEALIKSLQDNSPKLKIFPNPANDFVIIETITSSELTMFSSTGQLIREKDLNIDQNRLSLTGLASGVYYLRCKSELTGSEVKKLIIR